MAYIGIDPGTRNLAWAILTNTWFETGIYDMGKGKHDETDIAFQCNDLYMQLIQKVPKDVPLTDVIIERQMMRKYALIAQSILSAFAHDEYIRLSMVSASTVKSHFHIPLNGHTANKKNAILKAEQLTNKKMTDHEADAYLTALYRMHMDSGCLCSSSSSKSNHTNYLKLPCPNYYPRTEPLLPQVQLPICYIDSTDKDKDSRLLPSLPEKSLTLSGL